MTFKRFVLTLNTTVILFVVVYLYATGGPIPGGDFPEEGTYLFKEKMFGTLFSTFQIATIGLIALLLAFSSFSKNRRHELLFWSLSCLGFFFLALDEYYLIHENLDRWIISSLHLPNNRLTNRIDDLIVLLYGVIGILVLKQSWGWLKKYREFVTFVKVGLVFLFLMVLFDTAHIKLTPVKELEEDAFKLLGEANFLIAYFSCLRKSFFESNTGSIV